MQVALPERTLPPVHGAVTLSGMTVYETRWRNFRSLAGHRGGVTAAAEKLGKSQGQISHFGGKTPIKNIGDKLARQIESAYGKPLGWLDRDHGPLPDPVPEKNSQDLHGSPSQSARMDPVTLRYARDVLAAHYRANAKLYDFLADPDTLRAAYDYAADPSDKDRLEAFTVRLTEALRTAQEARGGQADRDVAGHGVLRGKGIRRR
jgi:hypothetical protein